MSKWREQAKTFREALRILSEARVIRPVDYPKLPKAVAYQSDRLEEKIAEMGVDPSFMGEILDIVSTQVNADLDAKFDGQVPDGRLATETFRKFGLELAPDEAIEYEKASRRLLKRRARRISGK